MGSQEYPIVLVRESTPHQPRWQRVTEYVARYTHDVAEHHGWGAFQSVSVPNDPTVKEIEQLLLGPKGTTAHFLIIRGPDHRDRDPVVDPLGTGTEVSEGDLIGSPR
jgi:hypothetical protein